MSRSRTNSRPYVAFPHPGETIREDYLKPLGIRASQLAVALRVPAARLTTTLSGRRPIDAEMALRLARYFNTTAKFWLNLQTSYDLAKTAEAKLEKITNTITPR